MNRDANYYLIEAKKANKIYRDLKRKYEELISQGIDSIETKRRAEFYKKKANQYINLYRKKLVIEKRKKQEKREGLREIKDKDNERELNQQLNKLEQDLLKKQELKSEEQQKNLKQREEEYKLKTGKEYNPLVTDYSTINSTINSTSAYSSALAYTSDLANNSALALANDNDNNNNNRNNNDNNDHKTNDEKSLEQSSLDYKTNNPKIFTASNIKKTKKRRQKISINGDIEMINLGKPKLGFNETLKNKINNITTPQSINREICKNIFLNGQKINNKYFYPSEFPKLTKIKPITVSIKKGGKRKSCKLIKYNKKV